MREPDQFDAFYADARHRLLLQTYALTGDLPAARSAVRDAFVAAWHHWRKVSRLDDPEAWVRPHAWAHAQRRATARLWHRDKGLEPDVRATLDALSKLTPVQRRLLLLTQLSASTLESMARETGLTDEAAQTQLQTAMSQFALHRDIPVSDIRSHLMALAVRTEGARFPRSTIIRRTGTARRRAHTGVGVGATVAALLLAGTVVHADPEDAAAPGLRDRQAIGETKRVPRLIARDLLPGDAVAQVSGERKLSTPVTHDNTEGTGINVVCQQDRYADPEGYGTLVRQFTTSGSPRLTVLQAVEQSRTTRAAEAAYDRTIGWYAGCVEERVQLLAAHRVEGAGDEAMLLVLRGWNNPVTTYTLGVARTGNLVTSVVREVADGKRAGIDPVVTLLGTAVTRLCDNDGAGACATNPTTVPIPPPPAETARGMLQVVDLPPVSGVKRPWTGTSPIKPTANPAATTCDRAKFVAAGISAPKTRSFLILREKLPRRFGVSQTVGRFTSPAKARAFVGAINKRMAACEKKQLSATVDARVSEHSRARDVLVWHIRVEVSDETQVDYFMALVRHRDLVSQVGFIPAAGTTMAGGAFHELALRALERLENLPS